ncbi:MAG: LppX_LprAFG lipoprotein [Actinomycetota bacterium]
MIFALALVACSRGEPLPPPGLLLDRAGKAMTEVESLRFSLDVDGTLSGFPIRRASGVLNRQGEVSATVTLEQRENLIEYRFILVGGTAYLKGSTAGFQPLPPEVAGRIYDPSRLLDPQRGLASVLTEARGLRTEDTESIAGVPTYRLTARIRTELLEGLSRLEPDSDEVTATLWIARDGSRLVRARIPLRTAGDNEALITLTFSRFNAPTDIKAPPL